MEETKLYNDVMIRKFNYYLASTTKISSSFHQKKQSWYQQIANAENQLSTL